MSEPTKPASVEALQTVQSDLAATEARLETVEKAKKAAGAAANATGGGNVAVSMQGALASKAPSTEADFTAAKELVKTALTAATTALEERTAARLDKTSNDAPATPSAPRGP